MNPRPIKTCADSIGPTQQRNLTSLARGRRSFRISAILLLAFPALGHAAPTGPANATLSAPHASPAAETSARGRELMAQLKLEPLPGESGYFAVIGRSAQQVNDGGRLLAAQSSIYYLLTTERPLNYLHWLAMGDTHILLEGGPVDYFIFHPDGHAEKITLGLDLAAGQQRVIAVPAGCWKSLRLSPPATHALMVNVLSPEWTADRVKIGAGQEFIARFAQAAPWTSAALLRELIGPNFEQNR